MSVPINEFSKMSIDEFYNIITGKIIGYIFIKGKLTIYLINKCKENEELDLVDIYNGYLKYIAMNRHVFVNPPLEYWLESKLNWCHKIANKLSTQFNITAEDALSDIYFIITYCYNKGNVYLGSLNYLEKSSMNMHLIKLRKSKFENSIISLYSTLDKEDGDLELCDIIGEEDDGYADLEYQCVKDKAIKMLKRNFSPREIDQILNVAPSILPHSLLQRLYIWRSKNKKEDLYDETSRTTDGPSKPRIL